MATAKEDDCYTRERHENHGGGCRQSLAVSVVPVSVDGQRDNNVILEVPASFQLPNDKFEKDFAVSARLPSSGQKQLAVLKVDELSPRFLDPADESATLFTINSIEDENERKAVKLEVEKKMMEIFFEEDDVRVKKVAKQLMKYKTTDSRKVIILSCRTFNRNFEKVIAVDEVTWVPEVLPMGSLRLRKDGRLSDDVIEKAAGVVERILQGLPDERLEPMPVLSSNLEKIRQKLRQAIEGNSESSESSSSDEENFERPTATVPNEVPMSSEEVADDVHEEGTIPPVLPADADIKFSCEVSEEGHAGPTAYWYQYENITCSSSLQLVTESAPIDQSEAPPDGYQESLEGRAEPARSTLQPQVLSLTCTVYSWCDANFIALMLPPFFQHLNHQESSTLPVSASTVYWKMMTLILHVIEECNEEECPVLRILTQGFARHVAVLGCIRDDYCPVEFCSHIRPLVRPADITQPSPCLLRLLREAFRTIIRRVPSLIQLVQMLPIDSDIAEDHTGVLQIVNQLLMAEHDLTADQARILLIVAQSTDFHYGDILQAVRDEAEGITITTVLQRLRQPPNERSPNMVKSDRQD